MPGWIAPLDSPQAQLRRTGASSFVPSRRTVPVASTTAGRRRRQGVALVASLVTAAGVLAGCSGGTSTSAPAGTAGWLSSIPDTATYRSLIAINDLRTLWTSAGLSFPPPRAHLGSGAGSAASRQVASGSQIGSLLLANSGFTTGPLGYSPLAISSEVAVGSPPSQLSLVEGPVNASNLKAAMSHLGVRPAAAGAIVTYTYRYTVNSSNPAGNSSNPAGAALIGVRHLAVLRSGGRAAAGGPDVPPSDVTSLLQGGHPSRSLASDPDVQQTLGLLKGADVMLLGTSLIINWERAILGLRGTRAEVAALLHRYPDLARLSAPAFGGYGYFPGNPTHATALAVAIYPNAKDATAAAKIVGNMLRSGRSFHTIELYAKLFMVDKITVDGDAVVARVTARGTWVLSQAVQEGDFPLFWSSKPTA